MAFVIQPIIIFEDGFEYLMQEQLNIIINRCLILNNISKYDVDEIKVSRSKNIFIGINKVSVKNKDIINTNNDNCNKYKKVLELKFYDKFYYNDNLLHITNKKWLFYFEYKLFGKMFSRRTVSFTDEEMEFAISHELAHYINGDLESSVLGLIYSKITTNIPILLLITLYNPYYALIPIVFNHLYTYHTEKQEIRADRTAILTSKDANNHMASLFAELEFTPFIYQNTFAKYLLYTIYYIKRLIGFDTHPSNRSRIIYARKFYKDNVFKIRIDKN